MPSAIQEEFQQGALVLRRGDRGGGTRTVPCGKYGASMAVARKRQQDVGPLYKVEARPLIQSIRMASLPPTRGRIDRAFERETKRKVSWCNRHPALRAGDAKIGRAHV